MKASFDIFECRSSWVKIQLYSNLEERVLNGKASKNCSALCQSIWNYKLNQVSKNQLLRSIERRDMEDFPFLTLKIGFSSPIYPSNYARKFKFDV